MRSIDTILKNTFGFDMFRPLQREIIDSLLSGADTLAILPTGGGKSLCYQIPALLFDGLTIVVSPLIALMKDQVEQLAAHHIPAVFLNSSLTPEEYAMRAEEVKRREVKLLYLAPESLFTDRIQNILDRTTVACITVDEAHCISEWGHDFRPEYRQIASFKGRFPEARLLALTATATVRVRNDIIRTLGIPHASVFVAPFDRPNLFISVEEKYDPKQQLISFVREFPGQSGIVYCFSRKQVETISGMLAQNGLSARPYHAGLESDVRRRNQEDFIRDDVQIIVATIAFGMGINKPNVRFVVHYDMPKSIEGYYQESGRAGRDGLPSRCLLLYHYSDAMKLRHFIMRQALDEKEEPEKSTALGHVNAMVAYAEGAECRRKPLLRYFGDTPMDKCGSCDNCTGPVKEAVDITILSQKFMSCVIRTGERFGAAHIVSVLLGADTKKIRSLSHNTLSPYGIGKELSKHAWMHLGRQLTVNGYLAVDPEYGSVSLTAHGASALRSGEKIFGRPFQGRTTAGEKRAPDHYDDALFQRLRALRKELAQDRNVPPYVVFSDRTLTEMARFFPQTTESMLRISGVGDVKLLEYGAVFIHAIASYCVETGMKEIPEQKADVQNGCGERTREVTPQRTREVTTAYNAGESIKEIMGRFDVTRGTVLSHLERSLRAGDRIRAGNDIAEAVSPNTNTAAVYDAFKSIGTERLRPIFEHLCETVSYDDIRALRLSYLCGEGSSSVVQVTTD